MVVAISVEMWKYNDGSKVAMLYESRDHMNSAACWPLEIHFGKRGENTQPLNRSVT